MTRSGRSPRQVRPSRRPRLRARRRTRCEPPGRPGDPAGPPDRRAPAGDRTRAGDRTPAGNRTPAGDRAPAGPGTAGGRGTPSGPPDDPSAIGGSRTAPYLTGQTFFPALISAPFQQGLDIAFDFAIAACLVAAVASLLRGRRYVHEEHGQAEAAASAGDDLEGRQGGVLRVGDPAPVGRHLAQRG